MVKIAQDSIFASQLEAEHSTRREDNTAAEYEEELMEINKVTFLRTRAKPKKRRAHKPHTPLDVKLLRRSQCLIKKDDFKDGSLVESDIEDVEDTEDDPNPLALILVPEATLTVNVRGYSNLPPGSLAMAPHLSMDMVQAIATNFLNMPSSLVTKEALEADDASPNVS